MLLKGTRLKGRTGRMSRWCSACQACVLAQVSSQRGLFLTYAKVPDGLAMPLPEAAQGLFTELDSVSKFGTLHPEFFPAH